MFLKTIFQKRSCATVTEGLPYSYLHLPTIPKVKKLPTILSREEIWRMLQSAELQKDRLLIGLIYGC